MNKTTANKVQVGDVIRKYAPYTYWLDFQPVTEVVNRGRGRIKITRADGSSQTWRSNTSFEVQ